MANKLDPMDLKQIIQLHEDGRNYRKTAKVLGISRNTVNNYIHIIKASEYSMAELLSFDSATLNKLFCIIRSYCPTVPIYTAPPSRSIHPYYNRVFIIGFRSIAPCIERVLMCGTQEY